jgi:hypothetical protein
VNRCCASTRKGGRDLELEDMDKIYFNEVTGRDIA